LLGRWLLAGAAHQFRAQIIQRAEALMHPHAPQEELRVSAVAEIQQRQALAQGLIGFGKLVRMFVHPRQIMQSFEALSRVRLFRQGFEQRHRLFRVAGAQEQLGHGAGQAHVLRLQLDRRLPGLHRLLEVARAEREIAQLHPGLDLGRITAAARVAASRACNCKAWAVSSGFVGDLGTRPQGQRVRRLQLQHPIIDRRRLGEVATFAKRCP